MEFKKLGAVEAVTSVSDTASVLIEEDGVIKRAPKNEVGGGAKKELVYEWNFSADDEVHEIYENVDEDLSWLTKRQDGVGFEIVAENYAFQYDWNQENGDHNYIYLEDTFATISSADVPWYTRYTNVPYSDISYVSKEELAGELSGFEKYYEYPINDTTSRFFVLRPAVYFNIHNGAHLSDDGIPTNVENGGFIVFESDQSPFKSVKLYKVTH